jgi:hypothetical protein
MIRATFLWLVACASGIVCSQAMTQALDPVNPAGPTHPRTYALVAAMGEQFTQVFAVQSTGSHLPPFRRSVSQVPDNILNRFALHSLDMAVAKIDPDSQRIYMALPAAEVDGVAPSQRETVAIGKIVMELAKIPQRSEWDRIVIATPAYRALELNGLPGKLQGFGMFNQPLCQGGCGGMPGPDQLRTLGDEGVEALTSDNDIIRARTYIAPFSYVQVWILDPKTLAILDKQQGFDAQKLADPRYKPLDMSQGAGQKYVAGRISDLIELSVDTAVMRSELYTRRGTVETGEIREVAPAEDKK